MIKINLGSKLAQIAYLGWRYRRVSKKTDVSFDTLLIGFYGNERANRYLDFYIENSFSYGIKHVATEVIDDLVSENLDGLGRLTK
ncbi:hypothetical protein KY328_01625 [Candidatus Woesearchaeota archaeon]|nr:hypothetical protein [Candidatus Woesearchaeota archaeon]MBW3021597.1 hypothetical protein [Candidatus Woesearchaeota archaeon]